MAILCQHWFETQPLAKGLEYLLYSCSGNVRVIVRSNVATTLTEVNRTNMSAETPPEIIVIKKQFDKDLRDLKAMLVSKKKTMSNEDWLIYIRSLKQTIKQNPSDFLSIIPKEPLLTAALEKVFDGFLLDQKIRDSQKMQNRWRYDI